MRTPMVASPHLSAAALTPRPPAAPAAPAGVRAHLAGDLVKGAAAPALQRHPLRRSRRPTRLPPAAANKWGNQNRLGEDKPSELDNRLLAEAPSKTPFLRSRDPPEEEPGGGSGGGGLPQAVARALAEFQGQLQYSEQGGGVCACVPVAGAQTPAAPHAGHRRSRSLVRSLVPLPRLQITTTGGRTRGPTFSSF